MTEENKVEEDGSPMLINKCGHLPDKCNGCLRANWETHSCLVYGNPGAQHRRIGGCPMRTHNKQIKTEDGKFIDPLKASKRAAKGK